MNIEHFALNVAEPVKMANWYVKNLGMKIKRNITEPPLTHFIADSDDNVMLEIYYNPAAPVPDYASMNPLITHICFITDDVKKTVEKLEAAGATIVGDIFMAGSDEIAILRDPWGLSIQFAKRAQPMI